MQLNNLVIISIPYPNHNALPYMDAHSLSPSKASHNPAGLKDDISWKKSVSAFKKFKGKKDKQTKTPKHSNSHIPFLTQEPSNPALNTNFSLVDNHIKFSLLNQEYELIKIQDNFDYFDPNTAPFFEFGLTYNFSQHNYHPEKTQEPQQSLKLSKKTSTTPKLRKQPSKKQKQKSQNQDIDIFAKTEKSLSSQNIIPLQSDKVSDPFIIIKASQFRPKQSNQCQSKEEIKRPQQIKKTKSIRKKTKYVSLSEAIYSREAYSRPRSQQLDQEENEASDERSMGYGNDELPMIQFDFGMHMRSGQAQGDNGFDNLSIYEAKDTAQVRARIRPFINSTQILQQYEFNQEFVPKEHLLSSKEEMELNNEQALEKA